MSAMFEMSLGSNPWGESCAQVGTDGYTAQALRECRAWQRQLRRHYQGAHQQDVPKECHLVLRDCPHDFGTYHEIVALYDVENEVGTRAAFWLEANMPEEWDEDAERST